MKKSRSLFVFGIATAFLYGCESTPVQELPFEDPEVQSELREQEKRQVYEEYLMHEAMIRQRQEVARNAAIERQRQVEARERER